MTLVTVYAHARKDGIAVPGCVGCHGAGGAKPSISVAWSPQSPAPGETVTLDVAIQAVNGSTGGVYVLTDGRGELRDIEGQGTRLIDASQIVHSAPKQQVGGDVRFLMKWVAPETAGGVVIKVWGLSANADLKSKGDGSGATSVSFAYGCSGTVYYADHDGDGYGNPDEPVVDCVKPPLSSEVSGDCNENDPEVYPGRGEICNGRDDDCDGQIDEELVVATQYEDKDGDGHGSYFGATVEAKCPPEGFASTRDDCDDARPNVYEGAPETCNYADDDCDNRVDENVREVCGIGRCARLAETCSEPILCTPGEPMAEECNLLDDDCDGQVDEGADVCGAEAICEEGECVPKGAGAGTGAAEAEGSCAFGAQGASGHGTIALLVSLIAASRRRRRAGPLASLDRRPPRVRPGLACPFTAASSMASAFSDALTAKARV